MRPFGVAIFLGAFLLFLVQPIIGKALLPWFGGTPGVWATCMLFFQCALLAGYAAAHTLVRRTSDRAQRRIFIGAIALALASCLALGWIWPSPVTPGAAWQPEPTASPVPQLLALLALATGLSFLVLSAGGPLLQSWYSRVAPEASPYPLYSLSNAGSLLALLVYPVVLEPVVGNSGQGWLWSSGFAGYAVACWLSSRCEVAPVDSKVARKARATPAAARAPSRLALAMWFALSLCGSCLLLATTNHLGAEIVVAPLLWIAPLAVYLLTLIIAFAPRGYSRPVWIVQAGWAAFVAVVHFAQGAQSDLGLQLSVYLYLQFTGCMLCHGELARLRPDPRWLTRYYLTISVGGAAGGVLVGLGAPLLLSSTVEYHASVVLTTCLLVFVVATDPSSALRRRSPWPIAALASGIAAGALAIALRKGVGFPICARLGVSEVVYLAVCIVAVGTSALAARWATRRWAAGQSHPVWAWLLAGLLAVPLVSAVVDHARRGERGALHQSRNFYGVLRVYLRRKGVRLVHELHNGRVEHGMQFYAQELRGKATGYYGEHSGLGQALVHHPRRTLGEPMRIGVIGLGVGTIAALGRAEDRVEFYELNPAVIELATNSRWFSFLSGAASAVEVFPGDARLVMARQDPRGFDVLAVDAFTGGTIPTHLLTIEAVELYLRHLRDDAGVVAFHVSNRYLDLSPVLRGAARRLGLHYLYTESRTSKAEPWFDTCDWVLLSRDTAVIEHPALRALEVRHASDASAVEWTDDHSTLMGVLVWGRAAEAEGEGK